MSFDVYLEDVPSPCFIVMVFGPEATSADWLDSDPQVLSPLCSEWSGSRSVRRVQPVEFVEICLKCALCNDMSTVFISFWI